MTRRRALVAVAAVVLVLGLGLTAGVFDTARFDRGDEPRTATPADGDAAQGGSGDLLLILGYWLVVVFALFGAAMAIRSGEGTPVRIALLGAGILVGGVLVYALSTISGTFSVPPDPVSLADVISAVTGGESAPAGAPEDPGGARDEPTDSPGFGLVIVAILVLGGVVLATMLARRILGPADGEAAATAEADQPTPAWTPSESALHREPDADANAIYAAWRELTTTLTVPDPETTTPAQFAEVAIDAGFDPGEVTDLTHPFRVVRYGHADPSPARVERAREAIERLEGTTLAFESETAESETPDADGAGNTASGGQP